jgi:membrane protease YdiL (CAAX protease family)
MMQDTDRQSETRLPAVALALIAPAPSLGVWAWMIAFPDTSTGKAIAIICKVWLLLFPLAWLLLIQRGRLSLSPPRRGGFGVAALLGLVISAVIFVVYFMLGERLIDADRVREIAEQNGIGSPLSYLAIVAYWVLVNSLLEEYAYRWFIFRQCEALMPSWLAVLGSAAVFTVHHVIALKVQFPWSATILASLGVFIGGAMWSWLYLRYRSVWPCYVSHAIVDIAVFVVGWLIIFGA